MSQVRVSIIIPTYNEALNLPFLAEEIFNTIDKSQVDAELIIVDDNSPDGTGKVAEELKTKYPIQVIHRAGKLGLGSAVIEGFKQSDRPYIGVMDADLSHDPAILNGLILALVNNDVSMGGRFSDGSSVESWKWWRKLLSNVGVFFARKLTGVKDPLSGYFFLNRNVISGINLKTKGYKILLEILVKGKYTKVQELAYKFRIRKFSTSKLNYTEYLLFFGQLLKYSFYKMFRSCKVNKDKTYFVLLAIFSLLLLFYRISARAFWGDEQMVLIYLHHTPGPLSFIIEYFRVPDNHAPLYYFLVVALYKIFPFGELGIRLVSALSGLGVVLTVYYFTVLLFKDKALARWAMFLASISSYFILISQMARYHSLSALLMLLSLYYFCKIILSGYDKKSFIKFLIFGVLVGYTDLPHFVYLVGITNVYYLCSLLRKNKILSLPKWVGGQIALGLLFLPIVYLFYIRVQIDGGYDKASLLGRSVLNWVTDFLMHFYAYFFGENILPWNWVSFILGSLILIVLLFVLIKSAYKRSLSREFNLLLYLFFASIIANTVFLNYADPRYNFIVYPKYVFVAFPLFIILITRLVFEIKSRYKYLLLSLIILVQVIGLVNFYQRQNYLNGSYFNDFSGYEFVRNNAQTGDYLAITGDMSIGAYSFYKDKYFNKVISTSYDGLPELLKNKQPIRVWFFSTGSDGDSAYSSLAAMDKIPDGFKVVDQLQSVPTDPILLKLKQRLLDRQSYEYKYGVYLLSNK